MGVIVLVYFRGFDDNCFMKFKWVTNFNLIYFDVLFGIIVNVEVINVLI